VEALLEQHAGAARAIELDARAAYDHELEAALAAAGFTDVALADGAGFLEAALVTEAVARAGGVVSIGASALVAPGAAGRALPAPIALATQGARGPLRFGAHARTLLLDAGREARVVRLEPGAARSVRSNFMLPVGSVDVAADAGDSLGPGSAARLRRYWRLALAAEILGTMQAALDVTVDYVKRRRQFGRPIGSFQALQHRLARCVVCVEGTRWLTYEAAARGAPEEATATAAAQAALAAGRLFRETHQLTGAMGFTREHDLHVFSMRLPVLRLELGGVSAHRRAVARARWAAQS
jgi:alkylation response protein AidB-like acyl-CoA dehydrogenase